MECTYKTMEYHETLITDVYIDKQFSPDNLKLIIQKCCIKVLP